MRLFFEGGLEHLPVEWSETLAFFDDHWPGYEETTLVCHYRPGWTLVPMVYGWLRMVEADRYPIHQIELWIDDYVLQADSPPYGEAWEEWDRWVRQWVELPRFSTRMEEVDYWVMLWRSLSVAVKVQQQTFISHPREIDRWVKLQSERSVPSKPKPMDPWDSMNKGCRYWFWPIGAQGKLLWPTISVHIRSKMKSLFAEDDEVVDTTMANKVE